MKAFVSQYGGRLHIRCDVPDHLRAPIKSDFAKNFPHRRGWTLPDDSDAGGELVYYARCWLEQWFHPADITWRDKRQQQEAHTQTPTPLPRAPRAAALEMLCLGDHAPDGLIDVAYRWWSQQLHPDVGGDSAAMVRLNAARDVLRGVQTARRAS